MRLKAEAIFDFGADDKQPQNKIVLEYRDEYKTISEILDRQPKILEMAHLDLGQLSKSTSRRGRKADFTSENLFRAILVMQREGLDYREASVRIAESETLQGLCRKKPFRLIICGPTPQSRNAISTGRPTPACFGTHIALLPGKCRVAGVSIR